MGALIVGEFVLCGTQGRLDEKWLDLALEGSALVFMCVLACSTAVESEKSLRSSTSERAELRGEAARAVRLLQTALPRDIARALLAGEPAWKMCRRFESATVAFINLTDYAEMVAEHGKGARLVRLLDDIFGAMDELLTWFPTLYKVETIGATYMIASGLPRENSRHAQVAIQFCLALLQLCTDIDGRQIRVTVGVNSGEVIGGVIGRSRSFYRVFGDTVNIASRMMSQGAPGHIHISEATARHLARLVRKGEVTLVDLGPRAIKGVEKPMHTYFAEPTDLLKHPLGPGPPQDLPSSTTATSTAAAMHLPAGSGQAAAASDGSSLAQGAFESNFRTPGSSPGS